MAGSSPREDRSFAAAGRAVSCILQAPAPVIVCRAEIPINGIRYVAGNAMMAGSVTANYLHSMGHRRIGILWTEPHNRTMRDLVDGFRTYARFNGLETELLDCATEYGENALDNTRAFLHRYLAEVPVLPFSALFVVSDETAVAALDALETEGIRVPQELSVVTFDDSWHARHTIPPLTCCKIAANEMGKETARLIMAKVADPEAYKTEMFRFAGEVIERESTAPPPKA